MNPPVNFNLPSSDLTRSRSINFGSGSIIPLRDIDPSIAIFDVSIRYPNGFSASIGLPLYLLYDDKNVLINRNYTSEIKSMKMYKLQPREQRVIDDKLKEEISILCKKWGLNLSGELVDILARANDWVIYTCENETPKVSHKQEFGLVLAIPEYFEALSSIELEDELMKLKRTLETIDEISMIIRTNILKNQEPIDATNIHTLPIVIKPEHFMITDRFTKNKKCTSFFPTHFESKSDLKNIVHNMRCIKINSDIANFKEENSTIPTRLAWLSVLDQCMFFLNCVHSRISELIEQLRNGNAILGGRLSHRLNNYISLGFDNAQIHISQPGLGDKYMYNNFIYINCSAVACLSDPRSKKFYKSHDCGVIVCQSSKGADKFWNVFAEVNPGGNNKSTIEEIETSLHNEKVIKDAKSSLIDSSDLI